MIDLILCTNIGNYKGITLFKLPNDRVLRFLNNNHGYEANLNHNTRDRAARFADVCVLGVASGTVWNLLGNLNDGTNIQVAVVDSYDFFFLSLSFFPTLENKFDILLIFLIGQDDRCSTSWRTKREKLDHCMLLV